MSQIVDIKLYQEVKKEADKKFLSKTSIYKSSWIVKEYKKRGGKYNGKRDIDTGLLRWFREKWVDITRPTKTGFQDCGRSKAKKSGIYPLCRPSFRITKQTPKTYRELSVKSINKAIKDKQVVKNVSRITFG